MQIQFGKTRIEINGGFMYIQAFGREVFVKRERGNSWMPHMRRDERTNEKQVWAFGLYAVI
jgi:hypothetical protein